MGGGWALYQMLLVMVEWETCVVRSYYVPYKRRLLEIEANGMREEEVEERRRRTRDEKGKNKGEEEERHRRIMCAQCKRRLGGVFWGWCFFRRESRVEASFKFLIEAPTHPPPPPTTARSTQAP